MGASVIRACLRCGSRDLRGAGIRDGAVPGVTAAWGQATCKECGRTGPPLEFDDEGAWKAFRKAQQEG